MEIKRYTTKEVGEIASSIPKSYHDMFINNPFLYDGAPIMVSIIIED